MANHAFPGQYNCNIRVFFVTSLWSVMRDAARGLSCRTMELATCDDLTTSAQLESNKSIVTFILFPEWTRSYRINGNIRIGNGCIMGPRRFTLRAFPDLCRIFPPNTRAIVFAPRDNFAAPWGRGKRAITGRLLKLSNKVHQHAISVREHATFRSRNKIVTSGASPNEMSW